MTIPNALAILFYPLYTFGHEFDIFTVCTAYNSILANLDIISNKCTLNNCAGGNFYAWHQYTVNDLGTLADWAAQREDYAEAERYYRKVLQLQPKNDEAQLGLIETQIATGHLQQARAGLEKIVVPPSAPAPWQRRLSNAWSAVGEKDKAAAMFANLLKTPQTDPLIYRDAARLMARDQPQQALDNYARSMAAAGLISPAQASPRDNIAMTEASRAKDSDEWLARSLRSDVDELYKQQNPPHSATGQCPFQAE